MRVSVHVRPGASQTRVGGEHDGALLVRVQQRAVNGAATEAVQRALANAFDVPLRSVTCVKGALSRRKIFEIEGDENQIANRVQQLVGEPLLP